MSKEKKLVSKIDRKPLPTNFTTKDLDQLMSICGCEKRQGGRGSSVIYYHKETGRILQFDTPHPGNELYRYQIKMVRDFLEKINYL